MTEQAAAPGSEQSTMVLPPAGNGGPPKARRAWGRPAAWRIVLAAAVLIAALVGAWSTWQPQRSDSTSQKALDLFSAGKFDQARNKANQAHDYDPLASKPYLTLAAVYEAQGHPRVAQYELEKAVRRFPADPQVWLRLADFQANVLNHPAAALTTVRAALFLDPNNKQAQTIYFNAQNKLHPAGAATPP